MATPFKPTSYPRPDSPRLVPRYMQIWRRFDRNFESLHRARDLQAPHPNAQFHTERPITRTPRTPRTPCTPRTPRTPFPTIRSRATVRPFVPSAICITPLTRRASFNNP
ncbi:hypothetical protein IE81DRAFT_40535 [Ceraceosorus guamensis]|uniref:Uncharacterized protein n=1 Tax=Ceraceosorus guamensis TaxID=1522189 RepID=A0A316VNQ8_9BASI|nr:hypothetical protein IE81DRAFT_40535 [Ceraceosorus guamensis]PWN39269.1 hypothetical protein IE81DRAFT_40535 [Ceraceosorus guamensis]